MHGSVLARVVHGARRFRLILPDRTVGVSAWCRDAWAPAPANCRCGAGRPADCQVRLVGHDLCPTTYLCTACTAAAASAGTVCTCGHGGAMAVAVFNRPRRLMLPLDLAPIERAA